MPLAFPGSTRKSGDEGPDPYELQFRDGKRSVPPHLSAMMSALDTQRYTYAEAISRVNNRLATDHVGFVVNRVLNDHFAEKP